MTPLEHAIAYRKLGWSVMPIRYTTDPEEEKIPHIKWKKYQKELASEDQIKKWWEKWPDANVGIITGKLSNLAVVDFDSAQGFNTFRAKISDLPQTITQKTGRASEEGKQFFFTYPNMRFRNDADVITDVDVRGEGGYVVVAPSVHASGLLYSWNGIDPSEDGLDDLCDMTPEMIDFFKEKKSASDIKNKEGWVNELLLNGCEEGTRNHNAAKLAGWFMNRLKNEELAFNSLSVWNTKNNPPLSDKELRTVLESIAAKEGTNSFGHETGITIDFLEILRYPDGMKEYKLFVKEVDYAIILRPEDIQAPAKFELKLLALTDHLYSLPRKPDAWRRLVNPLLLEAKRTCVDVEETDLATLDELIENDLRQGGTDPDKPGEVINRLCILVDQVIMLKMPVLLKKAEYSGLKRFKRKEMSILLKFAGYEYSKNPIKFDQHTSEASSHKVWKRDLELPLKA